MPEDFNDVRDRLITEIEDEMRDLGDVCGRTVLDASVMAAITNVPRHQFVPHELKESAYANRPLPIGYGQTISQPFVVAIMTNMLSLNMNSHVLEIGTGCGYQTAILAALADEVFSVEVVPELADAASVRLKRCGYFDVHIRIADGWGGWPEYAPYEAILVTAAAPMIPSTLVDQLSPGGRMVIPIGKQESTQHLTLIEKNLSGKTTESECLPVSFVPLVRSG